ncbi:MAG: hypothetical protein NC305_13325 [Lachnospiraceae bacterium]|nr:hypothetical protein [Butyrivibrio sp.]MCM1344021.1 hypothetical protein [Muribaculaceae bacterium]MCM1411512.1 hypothetical protein [Lachnospiraceae bacterium]
MIVSVQDALDHLQREDIPESVIRRKIAAIENLIRSETNNNFQRRELRFHAASSGGNLICDIPFFLRAGDSVEINGSVNEGLYTVAGTGDGTVSLDRQLYDVSRNMVTKVEYPEDVKEGVLNLLQWEFKMRSKTGIKSETLSRHSVTYYDMDTGNSADGYPVSLTGFMEPYRQMRW